MRILPTLNRIPKSRDYNIEFKGYNHGTYVPENQFYDTKNLCATAYPAMAPRALRGTVRTLTTPQGIHARGKLCWVDAGKLYYDGVQYATGLTAGEKQFVGMGAYILIFPDGLRFHTSTHAVDSLAAAWTQASTLTARLCRYDGTDIDITTTGDTEPEDPELGDYWLDTSKLPHVLKVYTNGGVWTSVGTVYTRITCTGIGLNFKSGDAVTISGCTEDSLNGSFLIEDKTDNTITVVCLLEESVEQASGVSIARTIPQMDFVCEKDNRIWGCSSAKNEIYGCKLGDPTNWYTFSGIASDSYAATIGSDGEFTGACSYGGYVYFWKEDRVHKLMGDKPSNFQLFESPLRGVQKGSEKSLCVVNETLLYKARDCVCAFDGSSPMDISEALGNVEYSQASGGALGDRYYISMLDEAGAWQMFVFDEAKGLWYREDSTHATAFAALHGQLYYVDAAGHLVAVRGTAEAGSTLEDGIAWYAETGDMAVTTPDNKYISRIQIRAGVDKGSRLKLEAMYDSSGVWVTIYERGYSRKASFTAPIIPMRCDHFRLRISGTGKSCVYGISKEYEAGSEI